MQRKQLEEHNTCRSSKKKREDKFVIEVGSPPPPERDSDRESLDVPPPLERDSDQESLDAYSCLEEGEGVLSHKPPLITISVDGIEERKVL